MGRGTDRPAGCGGSGSPASSTDRPRAAGSFPRFRAPRGGGGGGARPGGLLPVQEMSERLGERLRLLQERRVPALLVDGERSLGGGLRPLLAGRAGGQAGGTAGGGRGRRP